MTPGKVQPGFNHTVNNHGRQVKPQGNGGEASGRKVQWLLADYLLGELHLFLEAYYMSSNNNFP
jgi:hypothetical protein